MVSSLASLTFFAEWCEPFQQYHIASHQPSHRGSTAFQGKKNSCSQSISFIILKFANSLYYTVIPIWGELVRSSYLVGCLSLSYFVTHKVELLCSPISAKIGVVHLHAKISFIFKYIIWSVVVPLLIATERLKVGIFLEQLPCIVSFTGVVF